MCQSTVSKLVSRVLLEMENKLCPQHIRFSPEDSYKCKGWFEDKYKIPGVIGCVDGTHIGLQKPSADEHMYLNPRGTHSIKAMLICNHTCRISAINCKYGGAVPDSLVWQQSDQRRVLQEQFERERLKNSWLLGGSAYPLEPWLITPFRNPSVGSSESIINEVHSKARHAIEQTIGVLKGRWKILRYNKKGRYEPAKMARFANVCAALHNVCIQYKINYDQRNFENFDETTEVEPDEMSPFTTMGQTIRDQIKNSLFNST